MDIPGQLHSILERSAPSARVCVRLNGQRWTLAPSALPLPAWATHCAVTFARIDADVAMALLTTASATGRQGRWWP